MTYILTFCLFAEFTLSNMNSEFMTSAHLLCKTKAFAGFLENKKRGHLHFLICRPFVQQCGGMPPVIPCDVDTPVPTTMQNLADFLHAKRHGGALIACRTSVSVSF